MYQLIFKKITGCYSKLSIRLFIYHQILLKLWSLLGVAQFYKDKNLFIFTYLYSQTLLAGVERLRVRVVDPYQRVEKHTLILGRLQATCELLRRVIRCLMLSQRLQQQLANGPRDITKAASSLSELGRYNCRFFFFFRYYGKGHRNLFHGY